MIASADEREDGSAEAPRDDTDGAGDTRTRGSARLAALALLLLVPVPSLGTWAAMVLAPDQLAGNLVFVVAKVWLLAFPIVWTKLVDRSALSFPRWSSAGIRAGLASGLLIAAAIVAGYVIVGGRWIDLELFRAKLREVGFTNPGFYVALALYWCLPNALLEEYVWRWFVFSRCARIWSLRPAALAAGFFFTIHHVVAVQVYFAWPVVAICALGVGSGGTIWSWIYGRWGNLWAACVSHVIADVAVFWVGYRMLFP